MAYIGIGPASFTNNLTNVQILDDIKSGFNGNDKTFNLTANTVPFQAVSDRALMVILGGVIQAPGVDYTINGSQITFDVAPVSGLTFYARNIYGLNALNGVNDGIVGPYSLTTGGPTWDTSGNTTISGNLTVQGATTTISSTTLDVIDKDIKIASNQSTNAGIDTAGLLWGTTAVKLKYYNNGGTNPGLNIEGTNVGINTTAPTEKLHVTGNIKASGTVTATTFSGTLSGGLPITNGADNRVITASSASAIQGESTLTYDGTTLFCTGGTITAERGAIPSIESKNSTSSSYARFYCSQTTGSGGYAAFQKLGTTSTAIGGANATQIWCTGDAPLVIGVNDGERLRIDSDGHLTPGAAGTQDLGSTSKEFRHLYLGDSGKAYFGLDQDLSIYFNHSTGNSQIHNTTGTLRIRGDSIKLNNAAANKNAIVCESNIVTLYYDNNAKLATSNSGVTVTGEVAASQDYPTIQPMVDWNFTAVKKLDPRLTYQRTGPASYVDEYGTIKLVGYNVPRFDHDIITGECKGLLVEVARTNLVTNSTLQTDGAEGNVTKTRAEGPDGISSSALQVTYTAGGGAFLRSGAVSCSASTEYTFSIWIKKVSGSVNGTGAFYSYVTGSADGLFSTTGFVNTDGQSLNAQPTGVWKRFTQTKTTPSGTSAIDFVLPGYDSNGLVLQYYGLQLEAGGYATSYIPTDGETRTRGSDLAYLDGTTGTEFDDIYRTDEGTFVIDWFNNPAGNHNDGYVFTVDDGTGNNRIGAVNSNNYQLTVATGGSSQGNRDLGSINSGDNKIAFTYKLNDQATSLNGSDASVDTSCSIPSFTGNKYWWIGLRQGQYDLLGGYISRIVYYPKRLSNNQLKNLSS